ncbi:MAG TPA: undecaprenyl-diphosphate phosphatase [Lachnospiraceae bacterium]|nr:undecaprenyl-diphosphate phosphatase [Lachnospiraceae bacterium]
MIDIFKAILFGIVEGITEWLPISSTGHLILLEEFVKFDNVSENFFSMFEVVIQLGAILAVVVLFFKQIWPFCKKGHGYKKEGLLSYVRMDIITLWLKILVACIPAAIIGVLFDDVLDAMFYNWYVVAAALIVFGIAFILVENWNKGKKSAVTKLSDISYQAALLIGVFQLIAAVFPGTSRSGATIVGALLIGIARPVAAEFTFFLAIPVMFGASLLKVIKFGFNFSGIELAALFAATVVAFIVSIVVIKFLLSYIKKHDFKVFGWYRIVLGIVVILYFLFLR